MDLPDSEVLAAMTTDEFDTYWQALGVTVRLASVVKHRPEEAKREISNTSASTERNWSRHQDAPAAARAELLRDQRMNPSFRGLGFGPK